VTAHESTPTPRARLADVAVQPQDVFTPATPVRDDMFSNRRHEHLQDRVEAVLGESGRQVVLFGETGVGKTSLVQHLCRQRRIEHVRVECGATFEETMRDVLARVLREEEVERVIANTTQAELEGSLFRILTSRLKAGSENRVTKVKLPRSLPGLVAEALAESGVRVLFLDNFENVFGKKHSDETTRAIAEMLKLFSDRSADAEADVKIVVAGIPAASEDLIAMDEATARRTAQIEVPRMPADELDLILVRGGEKLELEFEGFGRDQIVQYSDGFPYYTHLYGLHCSRRAIKDASRAVTIEHFERGLDEILADCDLRLRRAYQRAAETSGEVRVRKTVMEALATVSELEIPFKRIREEFLKLHPGRYRSVDQLNFISPSVSELMNMDILADKGMRKSPRNLYRFKNPLMRGYVRLKMKQEAQAALLRV
jgi:KaiC/GvpD/RAD55 family RecA-like ATPase